MSVNCPRWGHNHTEIINLGIPPDIWKEQTAQDALSGKDTALTYALQLLHNR